MILRTSLTVLSDTQTVAVECLAFRGQSGAVLVHPAFREIAIDAIRSMPEHMRVDLLPSVVFKLNQLKLTTVGDPLQTVPIASILIPATQDENSQLKQLLHLALKWDEAHLSALLDLASVVNLVEVDHAVTVDQLRSLIEYA